MKGLATRLTLPKPSSHFILRNHRKWRLEGSSARLQTSIRLVGGLERRGAAGGDMRNGGPFVMKGLESFDEDVACRQLDFGLRSKLLSTPDLDKVPLPVEARR